MNRLPDPYVPLLTLQVGHDYYPAGGCPLRFEPLPETAHWLHRVHAAVWRGASSLQVLIPSAQLALDHTGEAPDLAFAGVALDPRLYNVTEGLGETPGHCFWFDGSRCREAEDGGAGWLHNGAKAGLEDRREAEAVGMPFHLGAGMPRIAFAPLGVSLPWELLRNGGATFRIALATRAPVWKYWLLGDWSGDTLQIVDLAQQVEFSDPVLEALDDGRSALTVRSSVGIALRQRAESRFQLRSLSDAAHRVLVKRLPVAGADHFARETIRGVPTLVSEIYVHR
jgi:hypothetical protein